MTRGLERVLQQSGLADPRLAAHHERSTPPPTDSFEQALHSPALTTAAPQHDSALRWMPPRPGAQGWISADALLTVVATLRSRSRTRVELTASVIALSRPLVPSCHRFDGEPPASQRHRHPRRRPSSFVTRWWRCLTRTWRSPARPADQALDPVTNDRAALRTRPARAVRAMPCGPLHRFHATSLFR